VEYMKRAKPDNFLTPGIASKLGYNFSPRYIQQYIFTLAKMAACNLLQESVEVVL
jgi:hypothetical protein